MKLSALYEETAEGVGFRNAKNLGTKIAKAMGFTSTGGGFTSKARNQAQNRRYRRRVGQAYSSSSRLNSSSVPSNPRHRKFFGMHTPQATGP